MIINFDLESLTGISNSIFIIALAALVVVLIIVMIVMGTKSKALRKRFETFMTGKDMNSLEDELINQITATKELQATVDNNSRVILKLTGIVKHAFQKIGVVKYDAFNEMGGKLSFSLALLDEKNDGFIINAMHSREGCYTYIKEIVNGNSYLVLAEEEAKALAIAKGERAAEIDEEDE